MSIPFYNNLDLKNNKIENLAAPSNQGDAANKQYVDDEIARVEAEIDSGSSAKIDELEKRLDDAIVAHDTAIAETNTNLIQTQDELHSSVDNINATIETTKTELKTYTDESISTHIVDNLETADATKSLSANQGVILNGRLEILNAGLADLQDKIIYSDEELAVGDWFGNLLYRSIVTISIIEQPQQEYTVDLSVYDIDTFIKLNGFVKITNLNKTYFIGTGKSDAQLSGIAVRDYNDETKQLEMYITSDLIIDLVGCDLKLEIYYTKPIIEE